MFLVSDPYFIKGEEALRGFCLRLSMIASSLKPLPEESSFAVHVHSTEAATLSLAEDHRFQDFPWIETDVQGTNIMEPTIVPLRTVDTGYLKLQMYVEESSVK
ncbi:hypothetical protein C0J52_06713 [Blattella germanica]|nr:hypothetical protein C0J52_06713 [Blattella germanica]